MATDNDNKVTTSAIREKLREIMKECDLTIVSPRMLRKKYVDPGALSSITSHNEQH